MSKKAYKAKKRALYIRIIQVIVVFGLYVLVSQYTHGMTGRLPDFFSGLDFIFGGLFCIAISELIWKAFRPVARMCEHFFVTEYDHQVIEWDKIEKVELKEKCLNLHAPEERAKTYVVSFSNIENAEELIEDTRTMCKTKGIAFEAVSKNTEDIESLQGEH
ncbi:MAG: hypothetical protein HXS52_14120 [Theionarchaea archaeon]|nr:hypothetical protein [Theionarchaea archaeon]